jgi:hypothetical protein
VHQEEGVPEQADRHATEGHTLAPRLRALAISTVPHTNRDQARANAEIRKSQATDEHGRKKRSDKPLDDSGNAEAMKAKFAQLEGALQEKPKQIQDQVWLDAA